MKDKVVLAYSGGVDTSVAIKWLQEKYNVDVIAVTIDVGNEKDFTDPFQHMAECTIVIDSHGLG